MAYKGFAGILFVYDQYSVRFEGGSGQGESLTISLGVFRDKEVGFGYNSHINTLFLPKWKLQKEKRRKSNYQDYPHKLVNREQVMVRL